MLEQAYKRSCFFPTLTFHGQNENQNTITKKKFLNLKVNNYFNSNNVSYKIIDRKDHVLLNHLYQKTINKKFINSFTIKYKNKNTTFLYFK